ncbi:hypothetical protein Ab1vBOLIVR4_gp78 [Agrobacterium phage OLIVR4]|nr:hypothetical protein Ab1vBOLIVR4_gp78 [Agrobacterium phage OLIVR4]
MSIAQTILQQLGGNRFLAMTGAKNLLNGGNYLQMDLGRGKKVRITLDASDTYTVETFKWNVRALECKRIDERAGVFCDNLRDVFTDLTGLYCTL